MKALARCLRIIADFAAEQRKWEARARLIRRLNDCRN